MQVIWQHDTVNQEYMQQIARLHSVLYRKRGFII